MKADEETPQAQAERLLVQIKEPHLEPHDGNWDSDCTPCKAQLELECCAVTIVEAYRSALAASQARLTEAANEKELREWLWLNHGCSIHALYGDDGEMQCGNGRPRHLSLDFKRQALSVLVRAVVSSAQHALGKAEARAEQADQQRRSAEELVLAYEKNLTDAQADIGEEIKAREEAEARLQLLQIQHDGVCKALDEIEARAEAGRAPLRALQEALAEVLTHFPSRKIIDELTPPTAREVRHCPPDSNIRVSDVLRWQAVLQGSRPPQSEKGGHKS
jgi:hypothetical protein